MSDLHRRAADFLAREARLLEQRLYATLFEGARAAGVVEALRGYQNEDGGFGHGLEPDKRCPGEPAARRAGRARDARRRGYERRSDAAACLRLPRHRGIGRRRPVRVAVDRRLPARRPLGRRRLPARPEPDRSDRRLLHALGVDHPWPDTATDFCWRELDREVPHDAHGLAVTLGFLEHVADRQRAEALAGLVAAQLPDAAWYLADADAQGYGLTPLAFAPTPGSRWRQLFDDAQIEAHLNRLERDQQADGGWPVTWEPPSDASRLEWRGIVTLGALCTLTAYGRLRR